MRIGLWLGLLLLAACSRLGDACTYFSGGSDTCGFDAECIPSTSVVTWDQGICHAACTTDADCASEHTCARVYGPDKVCWD